MVGSCVEEERRSRRRGLCALRVGLQGFPRGQGFRSHRRPARGRARGGRREAFPQAQVLPGPMSASLLPSAVPAAITVQDRRFMRLALSLGNRHLGLTWPNPSVGAVVVDGRRGAARIVGQGITAGGRPPSGLRWNRRAKPPADDALRDARAVLRTFRQQLWPVLHRSDRRERPEAARDRGAGSVSFRPWRGLRTPSGGGNRGRPRRAGRRGLPRPPRPCIARERGPPLRHAQIRPDGGRVCCAKKRPAPWPVSGAISNLAHLLGPITTPS